MEVGLITRQFFSNKLFLPVGHILSYDDESLSAHSYVFFIRQPFQLHYINFSKVASHSVALESLKNCFCRPTLVTAAPDYSI